MNSNLWQLDVPSDKTKEDYLKRFLGRIEKSIKKDGCLSSILIPNDDLSILKELLIGEPNTLICLNDQLMGKIEDLKPHDSLQKIKKSIENTFNYKGFLSNSQEHSYWLAKKIQWNTCVYCNRQYIFAVDNKSTGKHITRPVFDHWFPKSEFPLLSMSLFNLIPSCPTCNTSLKGQRSLSINDYFHPYIHDENESQITFRVSFTDEPEPEWTIKLGCGNSVKVKNTLELFGLNEIYASHGDLEVKDIMRFYEAYPQNYITQLFNRVLKESKNKMTKADVFRFFFGTEMESDKFLDRPLSKMKYDILKSLGVID